MERTIVFIHGMFLNPRSWEKWAAYFEERGYTCMAPPWPFHAGEPSVLREMVPPGLGKLHLMPVIESIREVVTEQVDPILVGHSLGGLISQILVNEGLASLAVPICSVAPNRMLSLDWDFFRNSLTITNPLKGDEPFPMDADTFHNNFANTMTRAESDEAWRTYAMHESRNVLRDAMGDAGKVDFDRPHVPMLFIAADEDRIVPAGLCHKNAEAYPNRSGMTEYIEFRGRGHFICGQRGWEEVAAHIQTWIEARVQGHQAGVSRTGRVTRP